VAPGKIIDVHIRPAGNSGPQRGVFAEESDTIGRLTRSNVHVADAAPTGAAAHAVLSGGTEIVVPLAELIDVDKECARMRGEIAELAKQIVAREGRLSNAKYLERAPEQVVASDRAILSEMKSKRDQLVDKVRSLCGG
jgi:valyl-tRNA synthetase